MTSNLTEDPSDYPQSAHLQSLHDSVPSLNTKIHQNYGLEDSNLVPITEEDEKSLLNSQQRQGDDLECHFERGGVSRSTIRNSKKRNFMELKLDMSACKKNNLAPTEPPEKHDERQDAAAGETIRKISVIDTPQSPLTCEEFPQHCSEQVSDHLEQAPPHNQALPPVIKRCRNPSFDSRNLPPVPPVAVAESPNLSNPNTSASPNLSDINISSSPNLSPSAAKLELHRDLSLSEGEDIFEDLSNEINDELSEDEEIFDKISMNLDMVDVDIKFASTFNESSEVESGGQLPSSIPSPKTGKIQHLEGKPCLTDFETLEDELQSPAVVLRKTEVKKDIEYWEKRASSSAESRVLAKNFNDNFKRGSLQRSTIKRPRKKAPTPADRNLALNRCSESAGAGAGEIVSDINDLLEMTSPEKCEKSANTVPYFDGKNEEQQSGGGCTRPQSITPKPAPRKKLQQGRTKILARSDANDQSAAHLPKLDSGLDNGPAAAMVFSINTWDERKKEKNRSLPTKRLVEWF